MGKTLYEKVWDAHTVATLPSGETLLYIDRHLVHEVTSAQAFEGLRLAGRKVRRPDLTFATADHNVPTDGDRLHVLDLLSRTQIETLQRNCAAFGVTHYGLDSDRQGIVHVIGPELGITLPGQTVVCGDSHTSTHGAWGSLAFGIGTSEVEHVLATQTLRTVRSRTYSVEINGRLAAGVTAKDVILRVIRDIGAGGATGHVVEYRGEAIRRLDMAGRMTVCNMSIEAGARAGLIAPDETTFAYLAEGDRPFAPRGQALETAVQRWRELTTDADAAFDSSYTLDAATLAPQVTWGTSPAMAADVTGRVPAPGEVAFVNPVDVERALAYMGLKPGQAIQDIAVDVVFIGSCTNGRIEDLRGGPRPQGPQGRARRPRACRPRFTAGSRPGGGRGTGSRLLRGGGGMAAGGLQHVPGDEPGPVEAAAAQRQHQQPQLRGPSGRGRPHSSGQSRNGGGRRRRRPFRPPVGIPRGGRLTCSPSTFTPARSSAWTGPTSTPTRSCRRGS